jgi:hypothetical protein
MKSGEEELAFLEAHLGELSPALLRQLNRGIIVEKKRREAEAAAKLKVLANNQLASPVSRNPAQPERIFLSPRRPPCHRGQAQSQQILLVRFGRLNGTCH